MLIVCLSLTIDLSSFVRLQPVPAEAINLDEGDELVFVRCTSGEGEIMIATSDGNCVRFEEAGARAMGRTARGVRGIKLRDGAFVVGVSVVDEEKQLVTITEGGYGKKTSFEDFRVMKHRGGFGVTCHKIGEKTGQLAGIATVSDDEDLMMITDSGTIIRTPVCDIPTYSRTAAGVIMMRLGEGQTLANFTVVAHEEIEDEVETTEVAAIEAAAEPVVEADAKENE